MGWTCRDERRFVGCHKSVSPSTLPPLQARQRVTRETTAARLDYAKETIGVVNVDLRPGVERRRWAAETIVRMTSAGCSCGKPRKTKHTSPG